MPCSLDANCKLLSDGIFIYTLDLAAGLTQVLDDGDFTYLYGNGRVAQSGASGAEYFHGDALGSVRQPVDTGGEVTLAQSYTPYGEVLSTAGEAANCAFTGGAYLRPG